MTWWPLITEGLAAIFWAAASVLQFRFGSSVFRKLNRNFWNPVYSSKAAKQIGGYKVDAFHLFQSAAIICFLAPVFIGHNWHVLENNLLDMLAKTVITGAEWTVLFPVTYGLLSPYHKFQ